MLLLLLLFLASPPNGQGPGARRVAPGTETGAVALDPKAPPKAGGSTGDEWWRQEGLAPPRKGKGGVFASGLARTAEAQKQESARGGKTNKSGKANGSSKVKSSGKVKSILGSSKGSKKTAVKPDRASPSSSPKKTTERPKTAPAKS